MFARYSPVRHESARARRERALARFLQAELARRGAASRCKPRGMQFALGVCSSSAAAAALGICSSSAAAARHVAARLAIDGIERRKIPIRVGGSASPLDLHVVEVADWSWWEEQSIDESANPFGAKLWPASLSVADYLAGLPEDVLPAMSVLEIGCGNGLCSLTVAARGAASVVASDLSEDALTLTREAAQQQGLAVQTLRFDLADRATPLPPAQLVIAADVLCARLRFEPRRARAAQLADATCRADDARLATTVAPISPYISPYLPISPYGQMTRASRPRWRTAWLRRQPEAAGPVSKPGHTQRGPRGGLAEAGRGSGPRGARSGAARCLRPGRPLGEAGATLCLARCASARELGRGGRPATRGAAGVRAHPGQAERAAALPLRAEHGGPARRGGLEEEGRRPHAHQPAGGARPSLS